MHTNKKYYIIAICSICVFMHWQSLSQNLSGILHDGSQYIGIGATADPNLNFSADYFSNLNWESEKNNKIGILTSLNLPLFTQKKGFDFDLKLGIGSLITFAGQFKMISGFNWIISRTEDINGRYYNTGFKLDLLPGKYGRHWVLAPHFSVDYRPWINLKHKDYPKQAFQDLYQNREVQYNSPKNGWFHQNYISLQGGISITYFRPTWDINFVSGVQLQPGKTSLIALPDIGILPFYSGLNFGYCINKNISINLKMNKFD
jgi:hypothetical protein